MRLQVYFTNPHKNVLLPINNNHTLARVIKKLASGILPDEEYSGQAGGRRMYTFSQLIIPERKIVNDKIAILSESFHWFIASPDENFVNRLAQAFNENNMVDICGFNFPVEFVKVAKTPAFSDGDNLFTCLSPVTVFCYNQANNDQFVHQNRRRRQYLFPEDEQYYHCLRSELKIKLIRMGIQIQDNFKFTIRLDREYLKKKNYRITKMIKIKDEFGNDLMVKGVLAPLRIKARPDILQVIYDTGLGQMNEYGFGMLEKVFN